MKKTLGWTVGIGIALGILIFLLIQMNILTLNKTPESGIPPHFGTNGETPFKIGVIPVLYDESVNENEAGELIIPGRPTVNDTPDWKNGAVLEEYTREIVFFDITRASLRPGAELVMAPQGCVAATQGDGPSQEFLEAEQVLTEQNVDTILYIPCPTDEVQVKKGREAIRQELGELYRQYFQSKQGKEKKLWLITPNPDETTEIEKAFEQEIETFNAHNPHYHITFVRENGICDPIEIEVKTGETGIIVCATDFVEVNEYGLFGRIGTVLYHGMFPELAPPAGEVAIDVSIPKSGLFTGDISDRTKDTIKEQLERWNYCEVDSDCETFYGECPFGCHQIVNKQFVQPAQQLIQARRENEAKKGNPQCVYSCMQFAGVQCKEQKCITRTYFPPQANRPQSVDDEDLERFRENPDETREILQKRRSYVDEYLNGTQYQGCSLSANGKYVVCLDPVAPSSGT